jgi:hypothetical protein
LGIFPSYPLDGSSLGISSTKRAGFPSVGRMAREKILDLTDGTRFFNIIKRRRKEEL